MWKTLKDFPIIIVLLVCRVETGPDYRYPNIDFRHHEQAERHRTSMFSNENDVIIRRGDDFYFDVKLNNNYKNYKLEIQFKFVTESDSVVVMLTQNSGWRFEYRGDQWSKSVRVHIPGNASVGVWSMTVFVKDSSGYVLNTIESQSRIIILFNPWSKEDSVYMNDYYSLNEYVMNERGILYHSYGWGRDWLFNQFKPGVLSAVMYVLRRSTLSAAERGNPLLVARQLTWLISDDGGRNRGVLRGNWNGFYSVFEGRRATAPSHWTGSAPILLQYHRSGGLPVAFGQCWVFAGLLTTILRALGIPSRPVTNLISGKDNSNLPFGDLVIHQYLDYRGYLNRARSDGIWNFHVWVSIWASRASDLGNHYSGWQEVDGTPQNTYDGRYQVGPSSQRAIRNADVNTKHETYFLFSEVNSDLIVYNYYNQIVDVKTDRIGKALLTKSVGNNGFEDITWLYKPRERTIEERTLYRNAARSLGLNPPSLRYFTLRRNRNTVTVRIANQNVTNIGSPVNIIIRLTNPTFQNKLIHLGLKLTSRYYFGVDGPVIKQLLEKVEVPGMKSKSVNLLLTPKEYINKLVEFNNVRVEAVVYDRNGRMERDERNIAFSSPSLHVSCPPKVAARQKFNLRIEFRNPLPQTLRNCYFIIEGKRIDRQIRRVNDIHAGKYQVFYIPLVSNIRTYETIVVSFVARNLHELRGITYIRVF